MRLIANRRSSIAATSRVARGGCQSVAHLKTHNAGPDDNFGEDYGTACTHHGSDCYDQCCRPNLLLIRVLVRKEKTNVRCYNVSSSSVRRK